MQVGFVSQICGVVSAWRCFGHGCVQNGRTPISIAAQNGYTECIEALAGLGADVNKADTVVCISWCRVHVVMCAVQQHA